MKIHRIAVLLAGLCALAGCSGGGTGVPNFSTAIDLECDVSPDADRSIRVGEVSVETLRGVTLITTGTRDDSITRKQLESLVKELRGGKRTLETRLSSGETEWVFYVVHNLEQPDVTLTFFPPERVTVNGGSHARRIPLPPGAHGFHVTPADGEVSVEHMYLPLDSNLEHAQPALRPTPPAAGAAGSP